LGGGKMKEEGSNVNINEISLIVPTRNEEIIVEKNLKLIYEYLFANKTFDDFEILVCDYSEDKTPGTVVSLSKKYPQIKYVPVKKKGVGIGIKIGMQSAKYDALMVYPIDMSWDIECIQNSLLALSDNNVILGSRGHRDSIVNRPLKRRMFSKLYNLLVNLFFKLHIKDTQCTIALRKSDLDCFIDKLGSDGPFFQTELLIHAKRQNLNIVEIPAVVNDTREDSSINPISDGFSMFKEIIRAYIKSNK
jgi:glycosyltransferase involved in cell wall biosynthesis